MNFVRLLFSRNIDSGFRIKPTDSPCSITATPKGPVFRYIACIKFKSNTERETMFQTFILTFSDLTFKELTPVFDLSSRL